MEALPSVCPNVALSLVQVLLQIAIHERHIAGRLHVDSTEFDFNFWGLSYIFLLNLQNSLGSILVRSFDIEFW